MFSDGVYTVLITPFDENGNIDYDSYRKSNKLSDEYRSKCERICTFGDN